MIRILAITADGNDGCCWYRAHGPLCELQRRNHLLIDTRVQFNNNPSMADIRASDVLFVLRPCTEAQLAVMRIAKDMRRRIWVDHDDHLFCIPSENPSASFYSQTKTRANLVEALQLADQVSVTTGQLKQAMQDILGIGKKVYVIPNAFDPLWDHFACEGVQQNMVLWRGTGTHNRDLMSVAGDLANVARRHPGVTWCFVGPNPWFITEEIENSVCIDSIKPITTYFRSVIAMKPRLMIAPLADNEFNRCKSPIAALEGLAAGAPCVARNWAQWEEIPSVIPYHEGFFKDALEAGLAMSEERRMTLVGLSKTMIQAKLSLEHTNRLRLNMLSE